MAEITGGALGLNGGGGGHRWPDGKIDNPGKWNKPHLNQGPLFFEQTNQKGHLWWGAHSHQESSCPLRKLRPLQSHRPLAAGRSTLRSKYAKPARNGFQGASCRSWSLARSSRFERLEQGYQLFSVVYFSRPPNQKRGSKRHLAEEPS